MQYLNNLDNDNKAAVESKSKLFGSNIPYVAKKVAWPNTDMLHPMGSDKDVDLISAFTMNVESVSKIDPSSEVLSIKLNSLFKFKIKIKKIVTRIIALNTKNMRSNILVDIPLRQK